ncbi:MAG: hypothetical protein IKM02_02585 [Clostridia bacterium]|nr:hypothetical protein [Clostridia bacterium]
MKRFVSAVLTLIMLVSCMNTAAAEPQRLTTERLLGNFMESLMGLADSPQFAMSYEQGENVLKGGLTWDEAGMPFVTGEITADGETLGADVSSEGIVVLTPEGRQGMRWDAVLDVILGELGLEGLRTVSLEDADVLGDIFEDILSGISDEALSVESGEVNLGTLSARELKISSDAGVFVKELDSAVPQALMRNQTALDSLLENWGGLLNQIFPDFPEYANTSDMIDLWQELELSAVPLEDISVRVECIYAGGISDPWELSFEAAEITFDAWYDGEAFQFFFNPGQGGVYVFDSRDAQYLLDMFSKLPGYITSDAFSYTDDAANGMRRIALDVDEVRLQKQLIAGLMQGISARREKINEILNRYRPWITAFAPEAASVTADALLMGLSVLNLRAQYPALSEILGIGFGFGSGIHFEAYYPVNEMVCGVAPLPDEGEGQLHEGVIAESAVHYTESAITAGPGRVELNIGQWTSAIDWDENSIEFKTENPRGWNRHFYGYADEDSVTCTYTRSYTMDKMFTESLSMTANPENIHIYSGNGDIDINIDIAESEALINARIEETVFTGTLSLADDGMKLFLTDGEDIIEAAMRILEDEISLNVNLDGVAYSAFAEWSDDRLAAGINLPAFAAEASAEIYNDGFEVDWEERSIYAARGREVSLALRGDSLRVRRYKVNDKLFMTEELVAEASWENSEPALDILSSTGYKGKTQDEFSLTYRMGQLMLISGGQVIHVSDITPDGTTDKNITRVSVYNALDYAMRNSGGNSAPVEKFVNYIDVTTDISENRYQVTVADEDGDLAEISINFAPESAAQGYEDGEVLWLTPELFRLMYLSEIQDSGAGEMPIPVYAEDSASGQNMAEESSAGELDIFEGAAHTEASPAA